MLALAVIVVVVASAQYVSVPQLNCTWQCTLPTQPCHPLCQPTCHAPACSIFCAPGSACQFPPVCRVRCPSLVGNTSWVTQSCPMCETLCDPLPAQCRPGCQIECYATECAWQCIKDPATCPPPVCVEQCDPPACPSAAAVVVVGVSAVLPLALCLILL